MSLNPRATCVTHTSLYAHVADGQTGFVPVWQPAILLQGDVFSSTSSASSSPVQQKEEEQSPLPAWVPQRPTLLSISHQQWGAMKSSTLYIVHSHPEKPLTGKHLRGGGLCGSGLRRGRLCHGRQCGGGLRGAEGSWLLPVPWASKTPWLPPARWAGMCQGERWHWAAEGDRLLASDATGCSPVLPGQHPANSLEGAGQDWSGGCSTPMGDKDEGLGDVGEA